MAQENALKPLIQGTCYKPIISYPQLRTSADSMHFSSPFPGSLYVENLTTYHGIDCITYISMGLRVIAQMHLYLTLEPI